MKKTVDGSKRSKDRTRKTISLPVELVKAIQEEADRNHNGDFTGAMLELLARIYPEGRDFLNRQDTGKFNPKKP